MSVTLPPSPFIEKQVLAMVSAQIENESCESFYQSRRQNLLNEQPQLVEALRIHTKGDDFEENGPVTRAALFVIEAYRIEARRSNRTIPGIEVAAVIGVCCIARDEGEEQFYEARREILIIDNPHLADAIAGLMGDSQQIDLETATSLLENVLFVIEVFRLQERLDSIEPCVQSDPDID